MYCSHKGRRYKERDFCLTMLTTKGEVVMDKAWNKACKRMAEQGNREVKAHGRRWDKKLKRLASKWNASASGSLQGGVGRGSGEAKSVSDVSF